MTTLIKRYPLFSYFLLAYGIFWAIWTPLIPSLQGLATLEVPGWAIPLALFGIYAPTWAALIVTAVAEGRDGLKRLIAPILEWKLPVKWYLLAIFLPLLLAAVALVGELVWIGQLAAIFSTGWLLAVPLFLATIPLAILVKLPLGPLAEELGWRGFALPRLQSKMSALNASLVLGLLWALWHLPAFWVPGAALGVEETPDFLLLLGYVVNVVGVAIIYTWLYNNTRGSLLIAYLFHAAFNALPALLFVTVGVTTGLFTWILWLCAILLVLYYGPTKLGPVKVEESARLEVLKNRASLPTI